MEKKLNIKRHHSQTSFTRLLFSLIMQKKDILASEFVQDFPQFDPNFFEKETTEEQQYPIFLALDRNMYYTVKAIMTHPKTVIENLNCAYTDEPFFFRVFMKAYRASMYNSEQTRNAIHFTLDVLKIIKNINQTDSCGYTILHYACEDNNLYPITEYICSREDAILDIKDFDGSTPLDIAIYSENRQAIKLLSKKRTEIFANSVKN